MATTHQTPTALLIPILPEPETWQDWDAWRLFRHAMSLQSTLVPGFVWTRLKRETLIGGRWTFQFRMLEFPAPMLAKDAEPYCRTVLDWVDASGRCIDWRDDDGGGAVAELWMVERRYLPMGWGSTHREAKLAAEHQFAGADDRHRSFMRSRLRVRDVGIDEASEIAEWLSTPW